MNAMRIAGLEPGAPREEPPRPRPSMADTAPGTAGLQPGNSSHPTTSASPAETAPGTAGLQPGNSSHPTTSASPAETAPGTAGLQPGNSSSSSGWRSRGYLPHFEARQTIQHITFRLVDSLPDAVVAQLAAELARLPSDQQADERRRRVEDLIDAGHGSCILNQPGAARLVENTLLHGDGERYRLLAWTVMPNHVHALIEPLPGWSLARIVGSWKSFTGRRLRVPWHREYWDRWVRDERHFALVLSYIRQNPVKAGLVRRPEDWRWSSAARRIAGLEPGAPREELSQHPDLEKNGSKTAGLEPGAPREEPTRPRPGMADTAPGTAGLQPGRSSRPTTNPGCAEARS